MTNLEALEKRTLLANAAAAALGHHDSTPVITLPQQHNLYKRGGFLTTAKKGKAIDLALDYLKTNANQFGVTAADFDSAIVTDAYTDADSGVTHVYFRQTHNGLEVQSADVNVNVMKDGRILSAAGGFIAGLKSGGGVKPVFSAVTAVDRAASKLGLVSTKTPAVIEVKNNLARGTRLRHHELSLDDIPARLHYVPVPGGAGVTLAWNVVFRTTDKDHWYSASVADGTGALVFNSDWSDNDASYNVLPRPVETPVDGSRSVVTAPEDLTASPFGWHDTNGVAGAEFTDTRGNNVSAQEDVDNNDTGGFRPDGTSSLSFNFPLDLTQPPGGYQPAAITNLFYWNNILHDIHYKYGFTEAAGNFQVNNYGKGGLGADAVQADAQDGSGTNNANFFTPPDGSSGRMQMYIFTSTSPQRDGDLDNQIIVHEFGHGVSNRLTGGPANANALNAIQSGGMGEGWSDWWGLMFTQKPTDLKTMSYPVGTYVLGQASTGPGIRRKPYAFDMSVDPLTYDAYGTSGTGGGVTRSTEVHNTGEIWCSTLWDLNWLLIDKYGFDPNVQNGYNVGAGNAGNVLALKLVMDALKLQPANPSFIDARNAILQADQVLTGGQNAREIWTAFARRGLGFSAVDSSSSATSITVAFDLPANLLDPSVLSHSPTLATITPVQSLSFNFSKAMDPTSFSVANDVNSFFGPGGVNLLSQITGFAWSNANQTLTVNFNAQSADGLYSMSIGPNILAASDGHPMNQDGDSTIGEAVDDRYIAQFRFDSLPMAVVSTTPANNSAVTLPLTQIDIKLNEAVQASTIGTNDLTLSQGSVTSATPLDSTTVRYTVTGLNTEGNFTFTLAAGALTDTAGNANLAFNGTYALDAGTIPFPTPLASKAAEGSLVYAGTKAGNLGFAGDSDSFTLALEAGQAISLYVDPVAGVTPTVALRDPSNNLVGTATAAAAGKDALLNSAGVAVSGTYTIVVSGAGTGNYTVGATLNAAEENEVHDGATNDSIATAQNIDSSFTNLGGSSSRGSVIGSNASVVLSTSTLFDFESGLQGWTANGLWHQSIGRGTQSGHSNTHSIYYGTGETSSGGGTYNTGAANQGSITSPTIALPNSSVVQLDFNYVLQTENSTSWDLSQIQISNNGGSSFTTLASLNGVAERTSWGTVTPVNLAAYAGQNVQLRFFFNTIDGVANAFEGWYIDDVRIQSAAPLNDYYSFTMNAGDSATIAIKSTNNLTAAAQLFDSAGNLLTNSSNTAQNLNGVITDFVAPTSGTYYVLALASAGVEYNLTVTKNAEFDSELNDSNATAQPVLSKKDGSTQRVLGNIGGTITSLINFDELEAQPADGLDYAGVHFSYTINGQKSDLATFGQEVDFADQHPHYVLQGDPRGVLSMDFAEATEHVQLNLLLDNNAPFASDAVLTLYNQFGEAIYADNTTQPGDNAGGAQVLSFSYDGEPIDHAELSFGKFGQTPFRIDSLELTGNANDWYAVQLGAGGALTAVTSTPGGAGGEPQNNLDPRLRIFNSSGTLLASDENSAGDGKNALLNFNAPSAGTYYVQVSGATASSVGDYTLSITGNTATNPPFTAVAVSPVDGAQLIVLPTQMTIDFNDSVLLTSLQASDLKINGVSATGMTIVDNNTVIFNLPSMSGTLQTAAIAAGAVTDVQGTPLTAFTSTFKIDNTAPRVVGSSVQEGDVRTPGNLTYTVTFDEPMKTTNLGSDDFSLLGVIKNVTYTPTTFAFDGTGKVLTLSYASLPEDQYTLTLLSGDGRFEDLAGFDMDGEATAWPIPPNQSGNGVAGGNFVLHFSVDNGTTAYPTPLTAKPPAGSLIYDPTIAGVIGAAGDTDSFTLNLDAGQTLTLVASGSGALRPTIELLNPSNVMIASATAAAAGQDAVVQTVSVAVSGTYTMRVSGAASSIGGYTLTAILNAAVENEDHFGPTNDTIATAQNIDPSFISLGTATSSRGAVTGRLPSATGTDFYSFTLAAGDNASIVVARPGTGSGETIALFDSGGTLLANGASGAGNVDQSIANFIAPAAGTYYVRVAGANTTAYDVVVTKNAAFDLEANNTLATAQPLNGLDTVLGAVGSGVTASGTGTPITPPFDVTGTPLSLGFAADGSFVGPGIGAKWNGIEFLRWGTYLAGYTVGFNGSTFTNNIASAGGTAFGVTMQNLSSGSTHAYKITGTPQPNVTFTRVVQWKDGDNFALVTTTITNNTASALSNVAMLDNQDPDPNGTFNSNNDVTSSNDLVVGGITGTGFMGLGSSDPRRVVSAEGFVVTNPFDVISTPEDPNGASADIAINMAFNIGTLAAGQSATTTFAEVFGSTQAAVESTYSSVSSQTNGGIADDDYYTVTLTAGQAVTISTSTPADGAGEFANTLNPKIELYNSSNVLIASDDNSASDGRNALLNFNPATSGTYRVHVLATNKTSGEYVLHVTGGTTSGSAFQVAATSIPDGAALVIPPTSVTIDFNHSILVSSLQAGDLKIDGNAASSFTLVDADTVTFSLPSLANGPHTLSIAAGAIQDVSSTPIDAFSSGFTLDFSAPQVINSSIQEGDVKSAGSLVYTVTFSKAMKTANLDASDFTLQGVYRNVAYAPASFSYNGAGTVLTLNYGALPEDAYTLTLLSGDGQFEDSTGTDLDGEALAWPIPPNKSGNGTPGGNFVLHYSTDNPTTSYPTPLAGKLPLGSMIYDPSITGVIGVAGDTDSFTLNLDAGQTLTLIADAGTTLRPTITLLDPSNNVIGTATSAANGKDAVLETAPVANGGTYTIVVGGAAGTSGIFTLSAVLNAATELENNDGAANGSLATAQNINGSFLNLGGNATRGAVTGKTDSTSAFDYYSFSATAGDKLFLGYKLLTGSGVPTVTIQNSSGTTLATAVTGATNLDKAVSSFTAPTTGTYYIVVSGTPTVTDYAVIINRNLAFDTEANDTISTAQNIDGVHSALGGLSGGGGTTLTLSSTGSGWWDNGGNHTATNTNYIAGISSTGLEHHNFFVFNLATVTQNITAASLNIMNPSSGYSSADPNETYTMFDVSTAIATLTAGGSGQTAIFTDLASGTQYGAKTMSSADNNVLVNIPLNSAALAALNAAKGSQFAFGGAVTSLATSASPQFVFGFSDGSLTKQLVLTLGESADWYSFNVGASGTPITVSTKTPADGPGQFANTLNPKIELYNPAGVLVASGVAQPDGRNEVINFNPTAVGLYKVRVVAEGSTTGEYVLTVNKAPKANTDTATTAEDTAKIVPVLSNDTDGDADPLAVTGTTNPSHGSIVVNADNTISYTPTANYSGSDSFTYTISDGNGGTSTATVNLTVTAVADAPTLTVSDAEGDEGSAIPLSISASLVDTDGSETLGITIAGVPGTSTLNHGTNNGGGTWTLTPADLAGLTITSPNETAFALTVTATAKESSNNDTASTVKTLNVTVNNVVATIDSIGASPKEIMENDSTTVSGTFVDPGNDTHTVTIDWGDGSTPSLATVNEANHSFTAAHTYLDNNGASTGYSISAVVNDGSADGPAATTPITVNNAQPEINPLQLSASAIKENDSVTVSGSYSDAGTLDTHTVMIDWGDGSAPEAATVDTSTRTFSATHKYLDDDADDTYTIGATVTDNDGASAQTSTPITVTNVKPNVSPITGPAQGVRGQTLSFSGLFSDVGTLDTHQVSWSFGNGVTIPYHSSTDANALNVTAVYTAAGTYNVALFVKDDDGGVTGVVKQVVISPIGIQGNDLYVSGTTGADVIEINDTSKGTNVKFNGVSQGYFNFSGRIVVYAQAGNDNVVVSRGVNANAEIYGQAGNDTLQDGGGQDIIVGGDGNDVILAAQGRDILIGGTGADSITAGPDDDIIIAGTTSYDNDPTSLRAIMTEWVRTDKTYAQRANNIRNGGGLNGAITLGASAVFNDSSIDSLAGASGMDWFFRSSGGGGDVVSDAGAGEILTELL